MYIPPKPVHGKARDLEIVQEVNAAYIKWWTVVWPKMMWDWYEKPSIFAQYLRRKDENTHVPN